MVGAVVVGLVDWVVVTIGGGAIILLLKRCVWFERSVADAWTPVDTAVTIGAATTTG